MLRPIEQAIDPLLDCIAIGARLVQAPTLYGEFENAEEIGLRLGGNDQAARDRVRSTA
jgi:hypothetical protein